MAKEKISGIYCIENLVNGKKYIGQSKNVNYRWTNHRWCLNNNCHSNDYLQKAWNKYGENNFKFYLLEECGKDTIDEKEKYYINFYKTIIDKNGYNLDTGGNSNKQHSELTKKKISKSNTGKKLSEETKLKISKSRTGKMTGELHFMYGKHLSDETKKKMSISRKGKHTYDDHYSATSVICLNTNKIFKTIKEAGEYYNTNPVNISKCCTEERNYSGTLEDGTPLQWSYYKDGIEYSLKEYERKKNNKPVSQYDLDGNFIATYKSAREAEKETGIGYKMISRVCKGERLHTHGFVWKFAS